jgi:hypothetical protein
MRHSQTRAAEQGGGRAGRCTADVGHCCWWPTHTSGVRANAGATANVQACLLPGRQGGRQAGTLLLSVGCAAGNGSASSMRASARATSRNLQMWVCGVRQEMGKQGGVQPQAPTPLHMHASSWRGLPNTCMVAPCTCAAKSARLAGMQSMQTLSCEAISCCYLPPDRHLGRVCSSPVLSGWR